MSVRKASEQNRFRAKNSGGPPRGMHLLLDSGDQNGNKVSCNSGSSPDSMRSISSLSNSSTESPADVEMMDCCPNRGTPAEDHTVSSILTNERFGSTTFHVVRCDQDAGMECLKSDVTSTLVHLDSKADNWNDNLTFMINSLQDSSGNQNGCSRDSSDRSADATPDSMKEGIVGSDDQVLGGFCHNGRDSTQSVSSSEMVLRRNSFSLNDSDNEKQLSVSVIVESTSSSAVPSEMGTLSSVLPDVCEGLQEKRQAGATGENIGVFMDKFCPTVLGIKGDADSAPADGPSSLLCEMEVKEQASLSIDLAPVPDERSSPAPCGETYTDTDHLQCSTGAHTPVEGRTFLIHGSEDSDTSCNVQTSTPVQGSKNQTFCVQSLNESPFQGDRSDVGSPVVRTVKGQRPTKPGGGRTPMSVANKLTKADNKRFPQPDFKNIKSKIMSRPPTPLKASNTARVVSTPSKSALANENAPVSTPKRPVQRKEDAVNGNKRRRSSLNQNKVVLPNSQPARVSDGGSSPKLKPGRDTSFSSLKKDKLTSDNCLGTASNLTVNGILSPSEQSLQNKTFLEDDGKSNTTRPIKEDAAGNEPAEGSCAEKQEVRSFSVSSKLTAASDGGAGRLGQRPSPNRARGASSVRTPAEILRLPPPVAKLKLGTSSKDGRTSGSMSVSRTKQISAAGNQKMRLTERPSVAAAVISSTKPPLNPVSPATRPAASSKLPVKFQNQSESLTTHSEPGVPTGSTRASTAAVCRPEIKTPRSAGSGGPVSKILGKPITKAVGIRNKSPQRKGTLAGCKNAALQNQMPSKSIGSPLQRTGSARLQRPATAPPVDKNKQKASPRTQQQTNGQPDLLPTESKPLGTEHYRAQCEKNNQCIQQLKKLLTSGNRRFEAITVVIQHIITERDEALKQQQELSQELVTLREELVTSATSCETLEKEKDELRVAFEGVLQKVQEQHQSDLADLEERLKTFYSAEWEKVHEAYQEEADKCKKQMQQQVDDLRSKHEDLRKELEASHAEKLESLKQQYETTLEELRKAHEQEMQTLEKSLKDTEAKLSEQIEELTTENNALNERVKAEEERRRMLAEKNQKDSHTLYLEQELESLKVVLDIKNKQLHQQDKKLMQMDKLMEKNVKLDECLKKVQQENEDLKARMDKHAALSRQLSTEQAVLQESLQKESKVNKRLSMENEELLWKLHNGDLSSPRKLSPSSPSKTFQSPRNSGVFSSAPVSPR